MYLNEHKILLLDIAKKSIQHGLEHASLLRLNLKDFPSELIKKRATFVTLNINKNLRGCIGTLLAYQPLVQDVAEHAFAAAFKDPRFPTLREAEFEQISISISILSPATKISFTSEADLIQQIRPGVDGLILEDGPHCGTFLPSVWESVVDPNDFLRHLKLKAGLKPNHWSETLVVKRYTTDYIE